MIFKHVFITCLLIHSVTTESVKVHPYPVCIHPEPAPDDRPAHFLLFIDELVGKAMVSRIQYFLKAISCEIPAVDSIQMSVISYGMKTFNAGKVYKSNEIAADIYRAEPGDAPAGSTACDRFRQSLGKAPSTHLEHKNVQYIVPIYEDDKDPGCFLRVFQTQFHDHPNKDSFFFNGILVNTNKSNSMQSIRMVIPDIEKAVDLNMSSLKAGGDIGMVHEVSNLLISFSNMIRDILLGKSKRDWEYVSTTPILSTTSSHSTTTTELVSTLSTFTVPTSTTNLNTTRIIVSTTTSENSTDSAEIVIPYSSENLTTSTEPPTTSSILTSSVTHFNISTTTTFESSTEESESDKFIINQNDYDDDDVDDEEEINSTVAEKQTTATVLSKRALPRSTSLEETTEKTTEKRTENTSARTSEKTSEKISKKAFTVTTVETTTLDQDYDLPEKDPEGHLSMAAGKGDTGHYEKMNNETVYVETKPLRKEFDASYVILILLLLLLIWLFCLFLCLIWMFRCAKNKKNKIEDATEEQLKQLLPLLESRPESQRQPIPSAPKQSTSTDSDEEEWKNIKPAKYTASTVSQKSSKSEFENNIPPPVHAQYAPVEVSEFEDRIDGDVDNQPRNRGYVPAKRIAPLRFD